MIKYGRLGTLRARKNKGDELLKILLEASKTVTNVKGCHVYLIGRDTNDKDVICVTEVWDSNEDHKNSLKLDEVNS